MFNLREELSKLPGSPGVYLMHNAKDEIIYVGRWDDLNIWYSDVSDLICNYVIR